MSAANENHEPVQLDDLHDRLLDTALAELAGQRVPPDLSGRITAAHEATLATRQRALATGWRSRRIKWFTVAVAASLLIGVGVLLSNPESNLVQKTMVALTSTTADKEKAQQIKIAEGVDEFNRLKKEHRYAEAEVVARRLNELAPDDPVANQVWGMAKFLRREMLNKQIADGKENAIYEQFAAVDQSAITPVPTDGREMAYDQKTWDTLAERSKIAPHENNLAGSSQARSQGPNRAPSPSNLSLSLSQTQSVPQASFGTPATTTVATGTLASDSMARGAAGPGSRPAGPEGGPSPVALDFAHPIQTPANEAAENSSRFPNFTTDLDVPFRQGSFNAQKSESEKLHQPKDRYGALRQKRHSPQSGPESAGGTTPPATTAPTNGTLSSETAIGGQTLPSPSHLTDDVQYDAPGRNFKLRDGANSTTPLATTPASRPRSLDLSPAETLAFHDRRGDDVLREIEKPVVLSDLESKLSKSVEGTGPGASGDKYTPINENPFIKTVGPDAVSTFSIDVDTASYSNVRQFLTQMNQLPPPDAVRIEELVNYFQYDYTPPKADDEAPFAAHVEVASCPWNTEHRLARIAVKGRELDRTKRPQSNLVFLVDVSGSMNEPAKLPLVVYGLEQLTKELGENDHIAIVVYASSEGLVLPSTSGTKQDTILAALGKLQAGGSTAGGAGIQLAYQIAEDNFIKGGTNRVILCTDGDFNVGVTSTGDLQTLVEKKAKDTGVFLSVLGFGRGNLNDAMMEAISGHGNGNYHYVDNRKESRRVLVEEMTGTLVTIAKDVKIQVEFNPTQVAGYRLIGYEDRMLRTEDFNNDKKDAGEIGAGHTVTAMYELIPAGKKVDVAPVDDLKYQKKELAETTTRPVRDEEKELLTLKMRYKAPDGDTSKKLEWPITDAGKAFGEATDDFQFASAVAGFGLLLRNSQYKGNLTYAADLELAQGGIGDDKGGYRAEFVELVQKAKTLKGE